jgi:hypothetical protein
VLNLNIFAFDVTKFPQPLPKSTRKRIRISETGFNSSLKKTNLGNFVALLRVSRNAGENQSGQR